MWNYDTLQYAAKTAGSYASVHGATCALPSNSCTVAISDIATVFKNAAIGIPPNQVLMTFTTDSGTVTTCNLGGTTNLCSAQTSTWPPSTDNQVGKTLGIRADYSFYSGLSMFAPGSGSVSFAAVDFPGDTKQIIQY
jgi:hypothetical protein